MFMLIALGNTNKQTMTNRTFVRYVQTAYPSSCYRTEGVFASYYGAAGVIDRGINWRHVDTSCLGLLLPNVYLLLSPALVHVVGTVFASSHVKVPSKIQQMVSSFSTLTRGYESYSFSTELSSMDEVRSHLEKFASELEVCLRDGKCDTNGYLLSQFLDQEVYSVVINRILYTIRGYLRCHSASQLVSEIAVSLAKLQSIPGIPGPLVDLSKIADLSSVTSSSVPFGPRKYVPLGNGRVSFIGEPSQIALVLSQLFVSGVKCEFDSGGEAVVNSPSLGSSVVVVETRSHGSWLLSYLQLDSVKADNVKPVSGTSPILPASGVVRTPNLSKQKGSLPNSRSYHSVANRDPSSRKWEGCLYVYKNDHFQQVGRLDN